MPTPREAVQNQEIAPPTEHIARKRANGMRTRDRLLDAAIEIWSEEGIDGITMNSVADRADRSRGTLYHHFQNRDELVEAAQAHFDDRFAELFSESSFDSGNPYALIPGIAANTHQLFRAYLRGLLDRDPLTDDLLVRGRGYCRWLKQEGWLLDDVDTDHMAFVTVSMWLAASLAVSLGQTPEQRRKEADKFTMTFDHVCNRAFFRPGRYRPGDTPPLHPKPRKTASRE
ncbi:TetR/AcrR family transcriptional regulator [soil metagenome]